MPDDVGRWLEELGLGEYAGAFAKNRIDSGLLARLTNDDLKDIGVAAVGDRRRLLDAIAARFEQGDDAPASGRSAEVGRRQLTVLFCDMVGSTEMSQRLDPEDLREVIRRYQDAVTVAAARYGGHVARYLGDGVLIYFGWPTAYEDQAERAIWAGLEALGAVARVELEAGSRLSARIGIASGQVVIGDLIGKAGRDVAAVTGETPNLAARLQGMARPGQVVIDAVTCGLVGSAFELEDLGTHELKGFPQPVPIWNVVGEGVAESRFEAARAGRLARFIGRQHELGLVWERWALAKRGDGQAVLLSGEAGIGKSRLIQALRDAIGAERHFHLSHQCSQYHTNSAFHPIVQRLGRVAGFTAADDAEARLDKLEAMLRASSDDAGAYAPLFAALLSLPGERRYGRLELSAEQHRERTIAALVEYLLELSRRRPVLFVLEDAHWIDPTTEEMIGEAMMQIADAPVLMLVTYRPDYEPPWSGLPNLSTIALSRLSREHCAEIVKAVGGEELPEGLTAQIIARASGVPLFVEELTRSLLESDDDKLEIPASLQASLTAKLDRLGEAGKVAQLAATLGRSFNYRFIKAVSALSDSELDQALGVMTDTGLLFRRGAPPQATYTFKHALIQDAAYETLLRRKRQQYHRQIADVLLQEFPEEAAVEPEVIARHLSLAGLPERAVEYWLLAGQRAGERSAHREAIASLESGLRELERLSPSPSRDEHEFALRIALGASLLTVKGWSDPNVEGNYERAQALSARTGDVRKLFVALRGLANVFFLKGEVNNTRRLVDRLLVMAQEQNDSSMLLEAYRSTGMCALFVGDFEVARENLQRANAMYDRSEHHALAYVYGTDPAVVGRSAAAWALWFLGHPGQAIESSESALRLARDLDHPFSLAYAQSLAASLHQFRRDPDAVLKHADAAIANASERDYPYWLGWSGVMRGWALAALGDPQAGLEVLQEGLQRYENTGARQIKPYILTMLAEIYGWSGLPRKGVEVLSEAFAPGNKTDVQFFEAEAFRLCGELMRQAQEKGVEPVLQQAIDLARRQGTRLLQLRAAISLCRAVQDVSAAQLSEIRDLLDAFDPALDDQDLRAARDYLAASGQPS